MVSRVLFVLAVVYTNSVFSSVHHGAAALPVVLHNGYLADTREVAAAKSTHLAAMSHGTTKHFEQEAYRYHGPTAAIPHVLHNGHIADTHEVAAAKADHLAAVSKAKAHGVYNSYSGAEITHGAHGDYRYHGPIAIPHVLHNGHIADTHEVAAAKADHLAAVFKAKAHGGYNSYSGAEITHEAHGDYRYHGPIAIPHVLHNGHIADTHEVAAAKADHLAAVSKAKAHGGYTSYSGAEITHGAHGDYRYHGPIAIPHVLHNGHIADTHEVAAAKAAHLAAVSKAKAHGGYNSYSGAEITHGDYRYHGPIAIPHVLHNGHIADTHEVAAAKADHLAAVSKAKAHGVYNSYSGAEITHGAHGDYRYHGPIAIPHVLHNGHIADTHEVAAAKADHLAAVFKAKAHGGYNSYSGAEITHEAHGDYRYHGPIAIPHVLHNGHIADTHEVAAAKADHLAAVFKAKAHGGYTSYSGAEITHGAHGDYRYHGPIAIPHVLHNGHIADTHEVAAAKAAHLAAVSKAKAHGGYTSYSGAEVTHEAHGDYRYHGPIAIPHVLHNGHIADTHEVAAAKAHHLAAVSKAKAHSYDFSGHFDGGDGNHVITYHGPLAKPVVLPSGYLADNPEVSAEKNHHLQFLHSRH